MVTVKNGKTGAVVGNLQEASHIRIGESLCDIPNRVTYTVVKKIYDMATGVCIGLVVE